MRNFAVIAAAAFLALSAPGADGLTLETSTGFGSEAPASPPAAPAPLPAGFAATDTAPVISAADRAARPVDAAELRAIAAPLDAAPLGLAGSGAPPKAALAAAVAIGPAGDEADALTSDLPPHISLLRAYAAPPPDHGDGLDPDPIRAGDGFLLDGISILLLEAYGRTPPR